MSFGGKFNYAKEYSKYKPNVSGSIFEDYIGDDSVTWKMIDTLQKGGDMRQFDGQGNPNLTPEQQADYWIKRGATTKAAFGRAHAAESKALKSGTYHGGTDVKSSSGKTKFETFMDTLSATPVVEEEEPARPGFNPYLGDNPSFPLLDTAYSSPSAPSWAQGGGGLIPDAYAPWASSSMQTGEGGYVPQNIWQGEGPVQGLGYGVTHTAPATGLINIPVEEQSSTNGVNTTTDASGGKWIMTSDGQWISATSDYGNALDGNGRLYPVGHYDQSGAYIGAETEDIADVQ